MTTKRAATALYQAGIPDAPSALRALVIYAAQNPGFEFGNYWSGDRAASVRAYRSDYRMALNAWHDVRTNARICASVGVTNADIYDVCKGSRVDVSYRSPDDRFAVDYCTGQYFPTEYRRAIARVLDRAATIAYNRAKGAA